MRDFFSWENLKMIKIFLFIVVHLAIFVSILCMGFLGFSPYRIIAATVAAFSLEAIGAVLYFGVKLKKTAIILKHVEGVVSKLQESVDAEEKIHREIMYLGHQIKTLQSQIDAVRKIGLVKLNGNGHHKGAHV